jgi:hypothetical protein
VNRFLPATQEDIFKNTITEKRRMVTAGETIWTSEAAGDLGITLLNLQAYAISESEAWVDSRLKQTSLQNARSVEAVLDGARHLGYKARTPISAVIPIEAKSTATTKITAGSVIKASSGETVVYLETQGDVVFTGAEVKKFFAVEGHTYTKEEVATGLKMQIYYLPISSIDSNSVYVSVQGLGYYTVVKSFISTLNSDLHCIIEYDYNGRPVVIFGDGIRGVIPPANRTITFTYRQSSGSAGNVVQGFVTLQTAVANIDYIKTKIPSESIILNDITTTSTIVEIEDDGTIDLYPATGVAYIGESFDVFSYTGISSNTFTGVTGLLHDHIAGVAVRFTADTIKGSDVESLASIKESALFYNGLKTSGNSNFEYARLAKTIKGVVRAEAYNVGHSTLVQIVPSYGGYPDTLMIKAVSDKLQMYQNIRNNITVINPNYAHIDVTVRLDPMSEYSWDATIKPLAESVIRAYINPLSSFNTGRSYYTDWGKTMKVGELTYMLFAILGGTYIGNLYIDLFARHGSVGNSDVVLNYDEISNIGIG